MDLCVDFICVHLAFGNAGTKVKYFADFECSIKDALLVHAQLAKDSAVSRM